MALLELFSLRWRFQEIKNMELRHNINELNENSSHFIPDSMSIFAVVILSQITLAISGVIKSKTSFKLLVSFHDTLCRIDNQLERPAKGGKFKYVACVHLSLLVGLLLMDYSVWKFTLSEDGVFFSHALSRTMCATILVQYEDAVSSLRARFRCINFELQRELADYFREDCLELATKRKIKVMPARTLSRRRVGDLFQLFWLTCRGVQQVNEVYGNLIFALLVMTSLQLIIIPHYFLITMFNTTEPVTEEDKICAVADSLWLGFFCVQLFVLVIPPALASAEANRTVVIVCNYLNTNTEEYFLEEVWYSLWRNS
nr:PREDICTED: uncharacterized protein LOC109038958 [Bemisia tabaci]